MGSFRYHPPDLVRNTTIETIKSYNSSNFKYKKRGLAFLPALLAFHAEIEYPDILLY